jgi:uncharacterized metal-binding protein
MGIRENKVETYLDRCVKSIGGLTRKWVSTIAGVPDRIVIISGCTWYCEIKTVDGKLSEAQKREHIRLRDVGAKVFTLYGKEGVDEFMEQFKC